MKKKICVLIGTFLSLTAMFFGVLQSMNTVSLSSTSADNVGTYTLDITSLSENNRTIKTKDGNTLSFYVERSWPGIMYTQGFIKNLSPINGLKSIEIDFSTSTADLTISYGWEWEGYPEYWVTDGIMNYDNPVYNFDGNHPSYFNIYNNSSQSISFKSITLKYSCQDTPIANDKMVKYSLSADGQSYYVSACYQHSLSIVIASEYNGLPVTAIGETGVWGCTELTSITIPNSITSIGEGAFLQCSALSSINLPNSLTTIGNNAFCDCTALSSINIPNSVNTIGYHAFQGCSSLSTITIPNGVTLLDAYLFSGCTSLASVSIPNSVVSIEQYAFEDCTSLTSIIIPSGVSSINNNAFRGCTSLLSFNVDENNMTYSSQDGILYNKYKTALCRYPLGKSGSYEILSSVTWINDYAFNSCSNLTSVIIPSGVTYIGNYAFTSCTSLTSVNMPIGVESIGTSTFNNCTSLISVNIPSSVTSISGNAFYNCSSLTSIIIPSSVTSIGSYVFYNCTSLHIYCEAASKPSGWNSNWNPSKRPVTWGYTE